jgi:DNA repair ATPase RecN
MGGRSGQAIHNSSGAPYLSGGEYLSNEQKADILSHAKKEMVRLGIKEDVEIKFKAGGDRLSGHVELKENPEKIKAIIVNSKSQKSIKSIISHELVHVEQINNGKLYLKNGDIVFEGKAVMTIKEYNKKFKGKWTTKKLKEYYNLPWETPAFKSE